MNRNIKDLEIENLEENNATSVTTNATEVINDNIDFHNNEVNEEVEGEDMDNEIILGNQRINLDEDEINEEMLRELLENEEIVMGPADLVLADGICLIL